jgi:transcription-repair coupling factor (superfamily II helicase)
MLENKIEDMKNNIDNPKYNKILETENRNIKKIDTSIDLNISAFINDEYFSSDLDKINFYREIESISNIEDLDNLIEDFKLINKDFSKEITNLFKILRLKII